MLLLSFLFFLSKDYCKYIVWSNNLKDRWIEIAGSRWTSIFNFPLQNFANNQKEHLVQELVLENQFFIFPNASNKLDKTLERKS